MNRFSSLLAGGTTALLAGIIVAAIATDQGVLPTLSWGGTLGVEASAVSEEWEDAADEEESLEDEKPAVPQGQIAQSSESNSPTIQYIDNEPIVHTTTVVIPAGQSAHPPVATAPTNTPVPPSSPPEDSPPAVETQTSTPPPPGDSDATPTPPPKAVTAPSSSMSYL